MKAKSKLVILSLLFYSSVFSVVQKRDSLATLKVNVCEEKVCFSFQTVINCDYFTIERSADAVNFETISTIEGAGKSDIPLKHDGVDNHPLFGTSYYRLKQVDFNGNHIYSNITALTNELAHNKALSIYPNPASDYLTIQLPEFSKTAVVSIVDVSGKKVFSEILNADDNLREIRMSVNEMLSGFYTLRLVCATKLWSSRLVVKAKGTL